MKGLTRLKLFHIKSLKLIIELKGLNDSMGREDPIEFYIGL